MTSAELPVPWFSAYLGYFKTFLWGKLACHYAHPLKASLGRLLGGNFLPS